MQGNETSAMQTLAALQDGRTVVQLTQAITRAIAAVEAHNEKATVKLEITIRPLTSKGLVEGALGFVAKVSEKLPEGKIPTTLFFIDENGQPSRTPANQDDMFSGKTVSIAPRVAT